LSSWSIGDPRSPFATIVGIPTIRCSHACRSWPHELERKGSRPEAHPLLGQIYGDVVAEDSETIAAVHDVDHPEMEMQAPALVTDADASVCREKKCIGDAGKKGCRIIASFSSRKSRSSYPYKL
jgi:hypothetical protein